MEKDIIINILRVTVNHLPLVSQDNQTVLVGEVNKVLDKYFANGGNFIKTDISGMLPPLKSCMYSGGCEIQETDGCVLGCHKFEEA